MGIFRKIFKSYSEKEVKRVMPIVEQINGLEEEISKLTDEQLKNKTNEFKKQLEEGKTLDEIISKFFITFLDEDLNFCEINGIMNSDTVLNN